MVVCCRARSPIVVTFLPDGGERRLARPHGYAVNRDRAAPQGPTAANLVPVIEVAAQDPDSVRWSSCRVPRDCRSGEPMLFFT